ncbi:MAG: MFS transporter [Oscillospiraceae bacterium]|nr:MFS transporter [Oscillospiraceae bacterium]
MNLLTQYRGLRREIYVLFFGRIVTNLGSMIWPVMTMILSQKLGFSAAEISYFFVGSGLIMLPANLIGGKLADRLNKKWMIVACDSVSIVCFFISAAIPLGLGTILLFVAAGVFQSIEYPAYDALFADLSTTKDRERAYSLMYLGGNLGLVLSPTIAGLLFKDYLWLSFLISGVSIALSTVLIAALIKDITPVEDSGEEASYQEKKDGASVFAILKENPLLLLYILCGTLYSGAYGQYNFIMPLDMAAVHGDKGAVIFGTVSSLNCITVVLFTPLITKLFANMRDTGKMITGRALVFGGYLVFLLLLGFIPGYYLAMLVFTWGEIFSTVAEGPYVSTRVPASHRGRINGLMSLAYGVVTGVIDIAAGQLYDRAGSTPTWILILVVTLVSGVSAILLKSLDRKAYPKLYGRSGEADAASQSS